MDSIYQTWFIPNTNSYLPQLWLMRIIMMIKFGLNVFAWQPSLSPQRVSVSLSLCVSALQINLYVCMCGWRQNMELLSVSVYEHSVVCVCTLGDGLLSFHHSLWSRMFCGFGFGFKAVTTGHGNLWSALFVTHTSFQSFLTPWHWGEARTACVCIVHCLFDFCFECVCS